MGDRAPGPRHSLMKTRYSRVKGAARSSLLKLLMVSEMCLCRRRRRCTATQAHSPARERLYRGGSSRLRTTSWPAGRRRLAFNAWGSPCTLPRPAHPRRRTLPDEPPHAPPPVQPRLATLATWPAPAALWKLTAGWWLHRDRALVILQRLANHSPLTPLSHIIWSNSLSQKALISHLLSFLNFRDRVSKILISLCLPNAGNILTTTTTPSPKQPLFKLRVWLTRL